MNEQLLTFIGEPVLDSMQRVIAHMFYLPGKVIDTIERERIGYTIYLSFSSYLKPTAQQPGKHLRTIVDAQAGAFKETLV